MLLRQQKTIKATENKGEKLEFIVTIQDRYNRDLDLDGGECGNGISSKNVHKQDALFNLIHNYCASMVCIYLWKYECLNRLVEIPR